MYWWYCIQPPKLVSSIHWLNDINNWFNSQMVAGIFCRSIQVIWNVPLCCIIAAWNFNEKINIFIHSMRLHYDMMLLTLIFSFGNKFKENTIQLKIWTVFFLSFQQYFAYLAIFLSLNEFSFLCCIQTKTDGKISKINKFKILNTKCS